jgi:nitroimidazol reductase NimA-like FMN-containing flavoprotein (pyridoxamine 5'-phosphate oxidase superfamily)
MSDPIPDRPTSPGYDFADQPAGDLLPWSWARERLLNARNYWLATTWPDGRPHAMPVWGVWSTDRLYFSTGPTSRKAQNLGHNPRCVVTTERADEAVIVEGSASVEADSETLRRFAEDYNAKYAWNLDPNAGPIYVVQPIVGFGFIEHADQFARTATRGR